MNVYSLNAPVSKSEEYANILSLSASTFNHHDLLSIQFEQLKVRLTQSLLSCIQDSGMEHSFHVAVGEATALAWTTPYPLFVFPCLLDEKIQEICQQYARQRQINMRMQRRIKAAFKACSLPWECK